MAETKERPISFTTELIPAVLDSSKTQTRRTRGLEEINKSPDDWWIPVPFGNAEWIFYRRSDNKRVYVKCPYGQVGDRLWVRETWRIAAFLTVGSVDVMYKADSAIKNVGWFDGLKLPKNCDIWHGGRWMPRWASRILLEITEIRVERLQEIKKSFIDVKAEGIPDDMLLPQMTNAFSILWDSINAKRGYPWAMNPWPWVLGLRRIDAQ